MPLPTDSESSARVWASMDVGPSATPTASTLVASGRKTGPYEWSLPRQGTAASSQGNEEGEVQSPTDADGASTPTERVYRLRTMGGTVRGNSDPQAKSMDVDSLRAALHEANQTILRQETTAMSMEIASARKDEELSRIEEELRRLHSELDKRGEKLQLASAILLGWETGYIVAFKKFGFDFEDFVLDEETEWRVCRDHWIVFEAFGLCKRMDKKTRKPLGPCKAKGCQKLVTQVCALSERWEEYKQMMRGQEVIGGTYRLDEEYHRFIDDMNS